MNKILLKIYTCFILVFSISSVTASVLNLKPYVKTLHLQSDWQQLQTKLQPLQSVSSTKEQQKYKEYLTIGNLALAKNKYAGSGLIKIVDNYVYIVNGRTNLSIVDITNPTKPRLVFSIKMQEVHNLAVAGNLVCVAQGEYGVAIIDLKQQKMYQLKIGWSHDVAIAGDYAYVTVGQKGIRIINVNQKSAQYLQINKLGNIKPYATNIVIIANCAYVTDTYGQVIEIDLDIENPSNSQEREKSVLITLDKCVYKIFRQNLKCIACKHSALIEQMEDDYTADTFTGKRQHDTDDDI